MPEKEGKLHDIKETASDAATIMRELAHPGVHESFEVIREIAVIAKDIMETMKSPEWQQNMENIRVISENINSVSARMDKTSSELKGTGIVDDAKDLISTIRTKMGSFSSEGQQPAAGGRGGISGQDLKELSTSFREMLEAVKGLASELKVTVEESKNTGTVHNIKETYREASDTYRTIKDEVERAEK
jgi:hypothetical protein